MTCNGNKYREVNLQPEDFHYLSYQYDRMNGDNSPFYNSKISSMNFFDRIISWLQKRENYLKVFVDYSLGLFIWILILWVWFLLVEPFLFFNSLMSFWMWQKDKNDYWVWFHGYSRHLLNHTCIVSFSYLHQRGWWIFTIWFKLNVC